MMKPSDIVGELLLLLEMVEGLGLEVVYISILDVDGAGVELKIA